MTTSSHRPPSPPPPEFSRPPHRTIGQIIGIGFAVVLPLLVVVFAARYFIGNVTPNVVLPPIQGPNPNAYDLFVQAGKQTWADKKDKDTVGLAFTARAKHPPTHAEKAALVAKYAPTLALVRQGLKLPYRDMSGPRSMTATFPQYALFRDLARLLVLEGDVKRESGDTRGAVRSYADCVVFGHTLLQNGPPLIGHLVGTACESIGRRPLWKMADKVDAKTARDLARRLDSACLGEPIGENYAQTLEEESLWEQAALLETFRRSSGSPIFARWSKQTILDNNRRYMEQMVDRVRKPYQQDRTLPSMPDDSINALLLPVFDKARYKSAANETQNTLLVTALALRAYQAQHNNAAPQNLTVLVPAYLPKLAGDPLSFPVAPLRYRARGGQNNVPLLYSVGPDNKDDNGVPAVSDDPAKKESSSKYFTTPTSKGDIVAGVNTQ